MFALRINSAPYPQRADWRAQIWLERLVERLRRLWVARWRIRSGKLDRWVEQVEQMGVALSQLEPAARQEDLHQIRQQLRRQGLQDEPVCRAFAHIRQWADELLGMRHFPTQLRGGYILLQGCLAEMDTGEGKSLTATLAAGTAGLAGLAVHIITVNEYLAQRDAEKMAPLFAAIGLSTGLVLESMSFEEKKQAYQADVVYCTSKILAFDHLRDRIQLGDRMQPMIMGFDRLHHGEHTTLLRGLQYAIVDEADSIFIDEARTPLVISASHPDAESEAYYRQAVALAERLVAGVDFSLTAGGRFPTLTEQGRQYLRESCAHLPGLWQGEQRRGEAVQQALVALYSFQRDVHYIVRDEKVLIVDETTGRIMPDRSWEQGLQQLVEVKEQVPVTPQKESLARISFQIFFRRYVYLSGMTGTCREVGGEVGDVYGLGVVRIPPHRPSRRKYLPERVFATAEERWQAVVAAIRVCYESGQPVLVGTHSILGSEHLSARLTAAHIPHRVLNAKQDAQEAEIIAQAGGLRRVTIATNMAGRGTDIQLGEGVAELGGLHVLLTEYHHSSRVDRQLYGRCARQGDPGSWQALISLEDALAVAHFPKLANILRGLLRHFPDNKYCRAVALGAFRRAQLKTEKRDRRARRQMLEVDFRLRQSLAFSGQME
ncbi:MAG: preprotein translocase subunit SecA [Magnetococcales bacterium]|nr:preprotein translocase subunit SecA [Magnetococcales bacterium]